MAVALAWFTIAYNIVEGVVAVWAGAEARAISLIGFGVDSGIEEETDDQQIADGGRWLSLV